MSTELRGGSADFTDPRLLALIDEAGVAGEPSGRVEDLAQALLAREPEDTLRARLADAAEELWDDAARERVAKTGLDPGEVDAPARENHAAHALAYLAALPLVARGESIRESLAAAEPILEQLDDEDRLAYGPALARAAVPALGVDVELLKDEGYRYVASYPPEGSEGVDIVGRAASWLTRRMTVDGDAPRLAMRRFLTLVADEVEADLPVAAALLRELVAEPMPEAATADRMFLSLARSLVEEAVGERGW